MRRFDHNPILTRRDIIGGPSPLTDVSSVFNPGAIRRDGLTCLLLRVQNRGRETLLVPAFSSDGIDFRVDTIPAALIGLDSLGGTVFHAYDPRIVVFDGDMLVTLAVDTGDGCRAIVTRGGDLSRLEYLGSMWGGEARNGVLFPKKIDGRYCGLVRPNETSRDGQPATGSAIWLVESDDLSHWRPVQPIMSGRPHYWDELIGSGPPPIKTREGWLHIYHGVATHFASVNIYQAGVCLLDLKDPSVLIARGRYNILEPREPYELVGQVPNVVFPTGLIVDRYDADGFAEPESMVTLYYGAADTVVAAAETTIRELIAGTGSEE